MLCGATSRVFLTAVGEAACCTGTYLSEGQQRLPPTGGPMRGCGFDLVVLAPKHPGHRLCLGANRSPDSLPKGV